jgi:copper chaperone NosL
MGAAKAVPFGTEPAARAFAAANSGGVVRMGEVPDDIVLGWKRATGAIVSYRQP